MDQRKDEKASCSDSPNDLKPKGGSIRSPAIKCELFNSFRGNSKFSSAPDEQSLSLNFDIDIRMISDCSSFE